MPLHMAGTEVYTHTLALLQQQAGMEVAVVTPHFDYYRPGKINSHYLYEGVPVYQYLETAISTDRDILSGKKMVYGLAAFKTLLVQLQPDIVHFHEMNRGIGIGVQHLWACKTMGIKTVVTMHLSGYTCNTNNLIYEQQLCSGKILMDNCTRCSLQNIFGMPGGTSTAIALLSNGLQQLSITGLLPKGKLTTLLSVPATLQRIKKELAVIARDAGAIVTLNEWYKNILVTNDVPADKVTVIRQALATTGGDSGLHTVNHAGQLPVKLPLQLIFIGRIMPQKGLHLLLEAMRQLPPGSVELHIYCEATASPYYQKCKTLSEGLPIQWNGFLPRQEVVQVMSRHHLLCLPSAFSEMSPLVIQEAFAAGIPVLASNVYGNAGEIEEGVNGWLFNFNDSANLTTKLQLLINNTTWIGSVRKHLKTPDHFNRVAAAYQQVYAALASLHENSNAAAV